MPESFQNAAKEWIMQKILSILFFYNKMCIITKLKCRNARKQNDTINIVCEAFESVFNVIAMCFVYITCNKVELSDPAWISMCQYIPSSLNNRTASTKDIYYEFDNNEFGEDELVNWKLIVTKFTPQYNIFCNKYTQLKKSFDWLNKTQIDQSIVIAQLSPVVTRIRLAKNIDVDADNDFADMQKTTAKFLEIEYKCGTLPAITIEVSKSHYFAGNEILSKTYVLRYLEHLPVYMRWLFIESEYSLRVIDEDSEVFSLNSRQYVRFETDGYKIVTEEEEDKEYEKYQDQDPNNQTEN